MNITIIGAGPAGLTAAWELVQKGHSVTVLEASDSIGGISKTVHHNKQRIDIGGHRFFSKDDRVMKWWQDVLPIQGAPSKDDLLWKGQGDRYVSGFPLHISTANAPERQGS